MGSLLTFPSLAHSASQPTAGTGTVGEGLSLPTETCIGSFSRSGDMLASSSHRGSVGLRRVGRAWAQVRVGVFAWGAGLGVLSPLVVLCLGPGPASSSWAALAVLPAFRLGTLPLPWGGCFGSLFPSHCPWSVYVCTPSDTRNHRTGAHGAASL